MHVTCEELKMEERKKAEEELKISEIKYRSLVEDAGAGVATTDWKGRFTFVNKALCRMMGYSKEELIGKPFADFLHPDDKKKILKIFWKAFTRPKRGVSLEFRVVHKKGHIVHMYSTPTITLYKNKVIGFNAIITDITERKKAEEALRLSEEKYRSLVENIPIVAWTQDAEENTIFISSNVEKVIGFTPDEIYREGSRLWDEIIHPDDRERVEKAYNLFFTGNKMFDVEYRMQRKDGHWVWINDRAVATYEKDGVIYADGVCFDITERKRLEERYRDLVEKEKDIIYTLDVEGTITFVSPAVETILGYQLEEVVGKNFMVLIPEEWQEKTGADFNNLLKTGEITAETVLLDKKGQLHFVEYSSTVIKEGNKVVGTRGIVRDITERKRMEEALKRQRDIAITLSGARNFIEALNRLFDNLLEIREFDCVGFYLVDKDTGALDMIVHRGLPDGFVEKVGHLDADSPYTKVVMEGKPIYQKTSDFPPVIRKDLQSDGILAAAAIPIQYKGEIIGNLNMASHTHDEISASTRQVLESVSAQIGENIVRARMEEKLKHYSEHLEELVQKRTEELLESETRYSILVEEANDGVAILQDGKIVFTNKKGPELIDYSRDELIGLPFVKLVDEKYRQLTKERYEQRLRGERILPTYEIELISKTGKRIPVELSATRINYQSRPADLIIVRDISERKRIEEEHLKLEKLAAIGELATMVGHDLRNPLQSIENAAYVLTNEMSQCANTHSVSIPQKAKEMLQVINNSVNYADKIIKDLQDFSAPQKPLLKKTNINAIVKENLSQFETPKNVKLITELNSIPEIKADKDMTKRVFLNLTMNGIQAMKNGGTLKISSKKTRDFVEVSFKDTGIGMSKENMGKIFTPFFTTRAKGMGMGLAICKKFVDAHHGNIAVESEEGKGTTFTVKLPIK